MNSTYSSLTGRDFIELARSQPWLWERISGAVVSHISLGTGRVVAVRSRAGYAPLLTLGFERRAGSGDYNGEVFFGGGRVLEVQIPHKNISQCELENELRKLSEQDRIHSVNRFIAEFWTKLCSRKVSSSRRLPRDLSMRDARLVMAWADMPLPSNVSIARDALARQLGEYQAGKLFSARIAEICAADYYRELGFNVLDVSVGQLNGNGDWLDFDLLVGEHAIDVKNSRKSFSSPDAYVEHCIPQFKESRSRGIAVRVCGVLSDYGRFEDIVAGNAECRVLGEVSESELKAVGSWIEGRFGSTFSLPGLWRTNYQPGWVFEYPQEHYPQREAVLLEAPKVAHYVMTQGVRVPRWLSSLSNEAQASPEENEVECNMRRDMRSLQEHVGFSKPSLYLFVMGRILQDIIKRTPMEHSSISLLRDHLYAENSDSGPLGLEDSQGYVLALLEGLASIYAHIQQSGIRFKGFRLTHPEVLKGEKIEGGWLTVLAYCGGWRTKPVTVKCGFSPLKFGEHANCENCRHLICPECGYCATDCELCEARQKRVANASSIS